MLLSIVFLVANGRSPNLLIYRLANGCNNKLAIWIYLAIFVVILALHQSEGAGYNDTISCEAFPEVLNYTDAELQAEAEM